MNDKSLALRQDDKRRFADLQRKRIQSELSSAKAKGLLAVEPVWAADHTIKGVPLTNERRRFLANAEQRLNPLDFAASVLNDSGAEMDDRKWAAELLMPYIHAKKPVEMTVNNNHTHLAVTAKALESLDTESFMALRNAIVMADPNTVEMEK